MNKATSSVILSAVGFLLLAGTAFAHVTVNPRSAEPGYSVATVRVPNEKDIPTVSVRVVVPEGVTVHGIKAVSGWTYTAELAASASGSPEAGEDGSHEETDGRITEITWTGGQIGVGEFEEFPLSVQYTRAGDVVWKAYQTYADGEAVSWDGGKDAEYPASVVAIAEKTDAAAIPVQPAVPQAQWLSTLALLVALAALFVSLRKK
jgi:uncharacterized protein YcnI